jgi:hypothetical protein
MGEKIIQILEIMAQSGKLAQNKSQSGAKR